MKFIIHIGPHKTGTSYIQKECADRRQELLANGVYYPKDWNTWLDGHTGLYHQLRQRHFDFFKQNFAKFAATIEPQHKVVLFSNENLEDLDQDGIEVLSQCFRPGDAKIVYYARKWPRLLNSTWQEAVKHGSAMTLPEFCFQEAVNPRKSNILNYNIVLSKYASVFGADNIIVRSYDNVLEGGGDVFEDILTVTIGEPSAIRGRRYVENKSFELLDIEIVRLLNAVAFGDRNKNPSPIVRESYTQLKSALQALIAELEWIARPYRKAMTVNNFLENFAAIERELLEQYKHVGPTDLNGRLFADLGQAEFEYYSADFLIEPRAVSIVQHVIKRCEELYSDKIT